MRNIYHIFSVFYGANNARRVCGTLRRELKIMRKITAFIAIFCAFLTGCATAVTAQSTVAELSGVYLSSNSFTGFVEVALNADGTYVIVSQGHMRQSGNGVWRMQGEQIAFNPLNKKDELAGHLTQATVVRHAGKLGFVRDENLKGERVLEEDVFLKLASQP